MWNGWDNRASEEQRTAYRLTKMENGYSIMGHAVEKSVMWAFGRLREGQQVTPEEAYSEIARPFLNTAWKQSKEEAWRSKPKQFCCLREHYYQQHYDNDGHAWTSRVVEQTKVCIEHFLHSVWPRIAQVASEHEVFVASPDDGDPESFPFEGVKVYAIPDFVYWKGEDLHIHDWKAGKPQPQHRDQVTLYGLWAHTRFQLALKRIQVFVEYLSLDQVEHIAIDEASIEAIKQKLRNSVSDMSEYLEGHSIEGNVPLPKEEWELTADRASCRRCNFYELCVSEF